MSAVNNSMKDSLRSAGWGAIVGGIVGLVAIGFLTSAVVGRGTGALNQSQYVLMFELHDATCIIQYILMIPLVHALFKLSNQQARSMSRGTLRTGIVLLYLIVAALLLDLPQWISNGIYMLPQGAFGIWLMLVNWRFARMLPRGIRWFGIVVGLGLLLFSFFLIGYTIFVSTIHLRIPAASVAEFESVPFNNANIILHQFIWIGTFMGVWPLPVWTMLAGRKLLRPSSMSIN